MRFNLLLLSVSFLNLLTFAQTITITGNVKDLETSSPIENAKVQIKDLQNGIIDSVFTDLAGNWQYDVITVSTEPITYLPNDFRIEQNFPNPFNPSTKINFSIPSEGQVTISVHNILGELINQKSSYLTAGVYTVDWFSKGDRKSVV